VSHLDEPGTEAVLRVGCDEQVFLPCEGGDSNPMLPCPGGQDDYVSHIWTCLHAPVRLLNQMLLQSICAHNTHTTPSRQTPLDLHLTSDVGLDSKRGFTGRAAI